MRLLIGVLRLGLRDQIGVVVAGPEPEDVEEHELGKPEPRLKDRLDRHAAGESLGHGHVADEGTRHDPQALAELAGEDEEVVGRGRDREQPGELGPLGARDLEVVAPAVSDLAELLRAHRRDALRDAPSRDVAADQEADVGLQARVRALALRRHAPHGSLDRRRRRAVRLHPHLHRRVAAVEGADDDVAERGAVVFLLVVVPVHHALVEARLRHFERHVPEPLDRYRLRARSGRGAACARVKVRRAPPRPKAGPRRSGRRRLPADRGEEARRVVARVGAQRRLIHVSAQDGRDQLARQPEDDRIEHVPEALALIEDSADDVREEGRVPGQRGDRVILADELILALRPLPSGEAADRGERLGRGSRHDQSAPG